MNDTIKINTASICFIGFFRFDEKVLKKTLIEKDYKYSNIYSQNKDYYDQKYYSNWIHSLFTRKKLKNHLKLKESNPILKKELQLESFNFIITEINVFLFDLGMALFMIKIDIPKVGSYKDIIEFGTIFRRVQINKNEIQTSEEIIEEYITSKFHSNPVDWRQYNPTLKSAIFIDIKTRIDSTEMDRLLYQIGTFSLLKGKNSINEPDEKYMQHLLDEGGVSIFKNWKLLCLYDSISRVAINLNKKDTYKLWENEYILIYIYVLYTRFFLQHTNNELTKVFGDLKSLENQRDVFYKFKNEFNHIKISNKFLPNTIYSKLRKTLQVEEEINLINEKLTRMNIIKQEKYQKRVNRILFLLTLLTIISVAYDGGQILEQTKESLITTLSLIILSFIIILLLYNKKK